MPHLLIRHGEQERLVALEKPEITIGRTPNNDLQIPDPAASRLHARIVSEDGTFALLDCESRNGTILNGVRIEAGKAIPLKGGDEFVIGAFRIKFLEAHEAHTPGRIDIVTGIDSRTLALDLRSSRPSGRGEAEARLSLLFQVVEALEALSDPPTLLERIAAVIFEALDPERVFIGVRDVELEGWKMSLSFTGPGRKGEFRTSSQVVGRVLDRQEALLTHALEKPSADSDIVPSAATRRERIRAAMCAPMLAGDTTIGVIYVDDRRRGARFKEEDLRYLSLLALLSGAMIAGALRQDLLLRRSLCAEGGGSALFIGKSKAMTQLWRQIESVAQTNFSILLLGETGTGKTMIAREIHRLSPRRDGPFVECNCAAIPEALLESELFGYAPKSGIANADPKGKPGRFELADGGTLFLDEIGDMPLEQQAKILKAIEEKRVHRIGATKPKGVNVRIIAATNRPIEGEIEERRFREDLYYRLAQLRLTVPPLRERKSDLPELAMHLLTRIAPEIPLKKIRGLSPQALDAIARHSWPGNFRDLENALRYAAILCPDGEAIGVEHLPPEIAKHHTPSKAPRIEVTKPDEEFSALDLAKRDTLIAAIREAGSLTKAAERLGRTKQWAIGQAKKFGIKIVRK
ncbi:MAG: FHA domain-containing protein [Deltaproteobacteria bacterium]|nr:MAG: FHA domain-containing protein [Deltaproteobacteria bacterium]